MEDTSNLTTDLQLTDEAIAAEKRKIAKAEALDRLIDNPDFILVIQQGYLEDEANSLFDLLTSVPSQRREITESTLDKLNSIRHFKEYIGTSTYPGVVRRNAEVAPEIIVEQEQYRKQITAYYTDMDEGE